MVTYNPFGLDDPEADLCNEYEQDLFVLGRSGEVDTELAMPTQAKKTTTTAPPTPVEMAAGRRSC